MYAITNIWYVFTVIWVGEYICTCMYNVSAYPSHCNVWGRFTSCMCVSHAILLVERRVDHGKYRMSNVECPILSYLILACCVVESIVSIAREKVTWSLKVDSHTHPITHTHSLTHSHTLTHAHSWVVFEAYDSIIIRARLTILPNPDIFFSTIKTHNCKKYQIFHTFHTISIRCPNIYDRKSHNFVLQ